MGRATDATRAVTQSANSIAALRARESERDGWIVRRSVGARTRGRARDGARGRAREDGG